MPRVKRGTTTHARHKKTRARARGYYGASSRTFRSARQALLRAGQYAYRDRRARKRDFRGLWIVRINAAARACGLSYSRLMQGLSRAGVAVDRKMLAAIAMDDHATFAQIAALARDHLPGKP